MKHLVVVAHPAEDSFTMALTRAYAAELENLGHSQRTYDLYRMGFSPALSRLVSSARTAALVGSSTQSSRRTSVRAAQQG